MNKGTKKNYKYNTLVVKRLSEKYGLSEYYIRECIRGDRNSETSDTVRKEYKRLVNEVKNVLNQ